MPRAPRTPRRLTRTLQQTSVLDTLGQHLQKIWGWYVTILVVLAGAILTSGPNLFLFQLAAQYPVLWVIYGLISLIALGGLGLIIWEWRRVHPTTQRVQYLEAVQHLYQVVPLVIDAALARERRIPLPTAVYQTLRYFNAPDVDRFNNEVTMTTAASGTIRIRTIKEFFEANATAARTVVILGRPGGGKTTLLRQSMVAAAAEALRAKTPVPIYVELPNFARFVQHDPDQALRLYLAEQPELRHLPGYAEQLQQLAQANQAFLFMDGLDEVAPGAREIVTQWMRDYVQHPLVVQPKAPSGLIVGTRFTVYERDTDLLPQKTELVAQQLDEQERRELALGLFPALFAQLPLLNPTRARQLATRYPAAGAQLYVQSEAPRFVEIIAAHPQRDLLGGNPLLFSLSAYVYVNAGDVLPSSRVVLYQDYIAAFLRKVVALRQPKDKQIPDPTINLDRLGMLNEVISTLAGVARWLFEQSTQTLEATDGAPAHTISREFTSADLNRALEQVRLDHNWQYSAALLLPWVLESGLLATINADQRRYQFAHQTYQEYLTAVALAEALLLPAELVQQRARATIEQHQFDARWIEPLSMLPGTLIVKSGVIGQQGRAIAREWQQRLWGIAQDPSNPHADDALYLLVVSFADIPQFATFGPEVAAATVVDAWAAALLRLTQTAEGEQIERFQRVSEKVALLPAAFTDQAVGRLQTSLGDDAHPQQQIAAALAVEGMGNLVTDLAPLTRLLAQGTDDDARVKAARALTKLKRYDATWTPPEYAPGHATLMGILQHSNDPAAIIVARSLKESGRDAEPLLPLVIAHQNPQVRMEGALALGSIATETAIKHLQQLSRTDPDPSVNVTALLVLSQLQATPGPLPLAALQRLAAQGIDVSNTLREYLPASLRRLGYESRLLNGVVVIIPPVSEVPAGPFLMGSDKRRDPQAYDAEMTQGQVMLDADYWIAQHPLTVAEYVRFIEATAYAAPRDWEEQQQRLDHPVVSISWNDTRAYVQWFARVTEEPWGMPTEAQWEKAARGTDGRIYPWGDQWDLTRANTSGGGPGTTPVGSYADGVSPYGVYDMAGNVWEWTSSLFQPYPYDANDSREDPRKQGSRTLRGGSWSSAPRSARAAFRYFLDPTLIYVLVGARVVCGVRPRSS